MDPVVGAAPPDAEAFRALARSSPWRWRTLRLVRRLTGDRDRGTPPLRAWVVRPGGRRPGPYDPDPWSHQAEPLLRADDLVPVRVLGAVREVDHHGRRAREAALVSTPAYDPRCSCCPPLVGEHADAREREGLAGADTAQPGPPPLTSSVHTG